MKLLNIDEAWRLLGDSPRMPDLGMFKNPNCIVKASRTALVDVLRTVGAVGGWWDEPVPFDLNGKDYDCSEWPSVEEFQMWRYPENQRFLMDNGWNPVMQQRLTMVIDLETSPTTPARLALALANPLEMSYSEQLAALGPLLADLKWVYIPLHWSEMDYALFATNRMCEGWGKAVASEAERAGLLVGSVNYSA